MSTLGPKHLDGCYLYETKPVMSKSYHFEWTIRSFMDLIINNSFIEIPFFPTGSDIKHECVFVVKGENLAVNNASHKHIFFTLRARNHVIKYVDTSLCLKSLDHVYKFPFKTVKATSSELFSFYLQKKDFEQHLKWNENNTRKDLTIILDVSFAESIQNIQKENELKFNDDISDHRNSILSDDSFKDFSFIVQDQTFKVSKVILALESPVFAAMFKSKMSEGLNSTANITDIEPEIFLKMIEFIYNQKIDPDDLEKFAPQLLTVAHTYDVNKLTQKCATFLYEKLCVDNALEVVLLADLYSICGLKRKALRIIKMNLELFMKSEDLKKLFKERPHLSLELLEIKDG